MLLLDSRGRWWKGEGLGSYDPLALDNGQGASRLWQSDYGLRWRAQWDGSSWNGLWAAASGPQSAASTVATQPTALSAQVLAVGQALVNYQANE